MVENYPDIAYAYSAHGVRINRNVYNLNVKRVSRITTFGQNTYFSIIIK